MTVDDSYDCRDVVEGVLGHMRRERIYPGREPTARVEREHTRGASQSCASREYISTPFFSVSKRRWRRTWAGRRCTCERRT
eukprot:2476848-Pyramimonas_sp.AAC.2